jgi:hypothetical protein
MAIFTGETGSVTWATDSGIVNQNNVNNCFGWTFKETCGEQVYAVWPVTNHAKRAIPTLIEGSGTCSCYLDSAAAVPALNSIANLTLQEKTGRTVVVSAFVTGRKIGGKADGLATCDIDFATTGQTT